MRRLSRYIILWLALQIHLVWAASSAAESDPRKAIIVNPAATQFSIKLISNPTTGYTWFLKNSTSELIVPIKQVYYPSSIVMPGAPGVQEFVFNVKSTGWIMNRIMQLTFVYARPWNLETAKSVTFTVVVLKP